MLGIDGSEHAGADAAKARLTFDSGIATVGQDHLVRVDVLDRLLSDVRGHGGELLDDLIDALEDRSLEPLGWLA